MATTLTSNNPKGMGYQTGYFSGPQGEPIGQHFFDAAFAGRINGNKIYKEAYHCNLVGECTMSTWLDEYMGYETDCYKEYTLLETHGRNMLIKMATTVAIGAYPATATLHLDDANFYVGGQFILPQVGDTIVTTPRGILIEVVTVNLASSGDAIITVRQRDKTGATGTQTVTAGDELLVLPGAEILDCACPTGQFRFPDLPIEHDVRMYEYGSKGDLCGDALNKCQWLKIPFTDECGNVYEKWYTKSLQDMYKDHEWRKHYERLLNPMWGIIPTVRARGMKWTPASPNEITTDDVRAWKQLLVTNGITCREYAIFAGSRLYSQWQKMLLAAGVVKLDNTLQPNRECKWIDMQYCGISVEGLSLHIYEDCSFSNGKLLGSGTSVFPDSAIIVPMCNRPACSRTNNRGESGAQDDKMLSTVYFQSLDGRVWDNLTDSNGVLNGPNGRNTFGTGCEEHQWTIKSAFLQEIHCISFWGFMGL